MKFYIFSFYFFKFETISPKTHHLTLNSKSRLVNFKVKIHFYPLITLILVIYNANYLYIYITRNTSRVNLFCFYPGLIHIYDWYFVNLTCGSILSNILYALQLFGVTRLESGSMLEIKIWDFSYLIWVKGYNCTWWGINVGSSGVVRWNDADKCNESRDVSSRVEIYWPKL